MGSFNRKTNLIQSYSLIVIDIICLLISYALAFLIRYQKTVRMSQADFVFCLMLVLFGVLYSFLLDWNHFIFKRGYFSEMMAILKYTVSIAIAFGFGVFILRQGEHFSRLVFGLFCVFTVLFTYTAHIAFKKYLYVFYKKSTSADQVLVVTREEYLEEVLHDIKEAAEWSYDVIGIALLDEEVSSSEWNGIPLIANGAEYLDHVKQQAMDAAFIYLPGVYGKEMERIVEAFETMGVVCYQSLGSISSERNVQSISSFGGHLVISHEVNVIDYRRQFVKRAVDIVGSLVGVAITCLVYPFVALAIKLDSKGPVLFKQIRIGRNGRRFYMYKFRSMYVDAEERKKELMEKNEVQGLMFKMENDPRITRVGRFLRKTSIDELPQFFNVLKGDMSLVGTRPPTVDEFEQYSLHYRRRLSITPGLTGMWQVSGRSDIKDFDEVVKLDLKYIDHWSLSLDIKILLQTVGVVLFERGSK